MLEFSHDGGSGGCDQLKWNVCLANWDILQNFQGGRSRQRIFAVRRAESALAVDETRKIDPRDLERLEADATENDIHDGVEGADFVKLDFLDGRSVDF